MSGRACTAAEPGPWRHVEILAGGGSPLRGAHAVAAAPPNAPALPAPAHAAERALCVLSLSVPPSTEAASSPEPCPRACRVRPGASALAMGCGADGASPMRPGVPPAASAAHRYTASARWRWRCGVWRDGLLPARDARREDGRFLRLHSTSGCVRTRRAILSVSSSSLCPGLGPGVDKCNGHR